MTRNRSKQHPCTPKISNLGEIPNVSIFVETHQFQRRLMHSTPNDHIYHLPMGVRVENGLKQGVQDRPRRDARSENNYDRHTNEGQTTPNLQSSEGQSPLNLQSSEGQGPPNLQSSEGYNPPNLQSSEGDLGLILVVISMISVIRVMISMI